MDPSLALTKDEQRLIDEAVARGLLTRAAADALCARREVQEDGSLQPISQVILLERAIPVPDFLALRRAVAGGPRGPARPPSFGPYRVVRELGATTTTAVFEGVDARGGRVAIKALLALSDATAVRRRRLQAELHALRRLSHPGIVRVHGASNEQGLPYFVMDLVPGVPLDRVLREQGPLSPADAATIVARVADAIQHAHERAVLHRDLKPANVVQDGPVATGRTVLVGFSLAKLIGIDNRSTRPGEIVGTPSYVAPELVRPEVGVPGPHSDVYGLGALLFELVAGRPPFEGRALGEVLLKVLEERPPSLATLRPDVPPELATLVARSLEKLPAARPSSAHAFAEQLRRAIPQAVAGSAPSFSSSVPTEELAAVPPPPPTRGARRARSVLLAALAVFLIEAPFVALLARERARAHSLAGEGARLEERARMLLDRAASVEASRALAEERLARHDATAAIAALDSALALRPERAELVAARARALVAAGRVGLARDDAARALALVEQSKHGSAVALREALLARAEVALAASEPDVARALLDLDRAAQLPGASEALALRARANALARRSEAARADLESARAGGASPATVALARAELIALSDRELAIGALAVARDADPGEPRLLEARARLLLGAGRVRDALAAAAELVKRAPQHGGHVLLLARACAAAEAWERAIALRDEARTLGHGDRALDHRLGVVQGDVPPASPEEVAARADFLVDRKRPDEARRLVEEALARHGDSLPLERVHLRALAADGDPRALALARKLADAPGPGHFLLSLARLLLVADDAAGAERTCDRALAAGEESPSLLRLRGHARLRLAQEEATSVARFQDAARDLERAARADPDESAEAWHSLARALLPLGRTRDALRSLDAAREHGCPHADDLEKLRLAAAVELPVEATLAEADRLRVELAELLDDEAWEPLDEDVLAFPSFGRGSLFGRAGTFAQGKGAAGARLPWASWREGRERVADRPALLDLHEARSLGVAVAARGDGESGLLALVLLDEAGTVRLLGCRRPLALDGHWRDLRAPIAGGDGWEVRTQPEGAHLDLARVRRVGVHVQVGGERRVAVWLDGLRAD